MTSATRRLGGLVVAGTAAVLTASCGGEAASTVAATPSPALSAPPPAAEPSAVDPETQASEAAFAAVREYMAFKDEMLETPPVDAAEALTVIGEVAVPDRDAAIQTAQESQDLAENGWRSEGRSAVSGETASTVDLAADPPLVVVEYCWNVADVRLVDGDGQPVDVPDRPDEYAARSEVVLVGDDWTVATEDIDRNPDWVPAEVNPCTS